VRSVDNPKKSGMLQYNCNMIWYYVKTCVRPTSSLLGWIRPDINICDMKIMMFVVLHVMILNTMQSLMRLLPCAHGWFAKKKHMGRVDWIWEYFSNCYAWKGVSGTLEEILKCIGCVQVTWMLSFLQLLSFQTNTCPKFDAWFMENSTHSVSD
jgi:hypothetical protein